MKETQRVQCCSHAFFPGVSLNPYPIQLSYTTILYKTANNCKEKRGELKRQLVELNSSIGATDYTNVP